MYHFVKFVCILSLSIRTIIIVIEKNNIVKPEENTFVLMTFNVTRCILFLDPYITIDTNALAVANFFIFYIINLQGCSLLLALFVFIY